MNANDYLKTLSENIFNFRKEKGLTQESLAEKLNISFQAVSKWETGQTSPDIIMIPMLAELFEVSIDTLFGVNTGSFSGTTDWEDDNVIRGVVYRGKKILSCNDDLSKFTFTVEGDAVNVEAGCNVNCNSVEGDVDAGGNVSCGNIEGDVDAGGGVSCGNIGGDADAGGSITCGNIEGDADAGGSIHCESVSGDANAGGEIKCSSIGGDASAGSIIECSSIGGDASAGTSIKCVNIGGKADSGC